MISPCAVKLIYDPEFFEFAAVLYLNALLKSKITAVIYAINNHMSAVIRCLICLLYSSSFPVIICNIRIIFRKSKLLCSFDQILKLKPKCMQINSAVLTSTECRPRIIYLGFMKSYSTQKLPCKHDHTKLSGCCATDLLQNQ